jgi:environmental stress-induced protein Ves
MPKKSAIPDLKSQILRISDCPWVPWKNGLGKTKELAKDGSHPHYWRLSSAQLERDCAFSDFHGYDRILGLLSGGPVTLIHDPGRVRKLEVLSFYKFSGDLKTEAEVDSPAIDLNLFLLQGKSNGSIYPTFFGAHEEYQFPLSAREHFVFCLEGNLKIVERHQTVELDLSSNEILQVSREAHYEYPNLKIISQTHSAKALWIPIHLL